MSKMKKFSRFIICALCLSAVMHELFIILSYQPSSLAKSSVTIALYISLALVAIIYDRTLFFSGYLIKINTPTFLSLLAGFVCIEAIAYFLLFGDYPSSHRIHRLAPFNMLIAFMFFCIAMLSIFGEKHLGIIGKFRTRSFASHD